MSFINKIKTELKKSLSTKEIKEPKHEFGSLDYTIPQIPLIIERKNDPWVWYGEDNLYPLRISDLRSGSGIHNSIINFKTKMNSGNGWLINSAKTLEESDVIYNSLPENEKQAYDLFVNNPNNEENTQLVKEKCADDYQTYGACAFEFIFNIDFTKIVRIKYVNVENLRAGKIEDDKVLSYWYSRNWYKVGKRQCKPTEIFTFDPNDKEHMNQLVYVKKGKNEYYGDIPYKGCLNWIMIDFKMGLFHLSNIDNGMNPGMWFKFYQKPASEAAKQEILDDLNNQYKGAMKANKFVATFSPSKELAMDIQPVQNSNLDKQLLLLAELSDKKILTGHQLTSPLLAGISISGSLGGNTELQTAFKILDNISMASDRFALDSAFQKALDYNKSEIKIKTNPWTPFV